VGKIIVHTKSNKTGKRILTTPLQEKYVSAPANRKYYQACNKIEAEFKSKMCNPQHKYTKTLARFIASYIANKSSSVQETFALVEYFAYGSMNGSSGRIDITRFENISGLSDIEEKAWRTCQKEFSILWRKRESDLEIASYEHDKMKRQLWREVAGEIFLPRE
jgi:hypothetical protein